MQLRSRSCQALKIRSIPSSLTPSSFPFPFSLSLPPSGDDGQDDDVDIDDYDDEDIGIDDADSLAASGVDRGAGGLGGGSGGSGVGGGGGGGGGNKGRRRRTAFTSEQLLELEKEFHAKKYLSLTERSQIAHTLKLSEVQVQSSFV